MHPILFQTDLFGLLYASFTTRVAAIAILGGVLAVGLAAYQGAKKAWSGQAFLWLLGGLGMLVGLARVLPREPWALHAYGVLIAAGFLCAMILASRQAQREGEDPDSIIDLAFYVLLTGLVGARIVFIFTKLPEYVEDPMRIVRFWQGGLVWYGGFIGAVGYVLWYCKKNRLPFLKYADIIIPYMALAHALGRLGCLAAGCCFGAPTDLPWGIVFPNGSMAHQAHQSAQLVGFTDAALAVHPTQLYEAGAELVMFWLLVFVRTQKRFHGQLFLIWLAAYPVIRSTIEMFRGDKERGVFILSTSQYISIAVAAAAVGLFFHLRRQRLRSTREAPAIGLVASGG